MICPKCKGDTRVVSSRPHAADATVIVRRRHCVACPHRFETQEGTINIAQIRANRTKRKQRERAAQPEEVRKARNRRDYMRLEARREAAETGRPVAEILAAWSPPPSPGGRVAPTSDQRSSA